MNIYALIGHKVIVTEQSANNGYDYHQEKVKEYLTIGKEYTVEKTIVHRSSTEVFLKEVPGQIFNSANFEDVNEQSKDKDKLHDCYHFYNS